MSSLRHGSCTTLTQTFEGVGTQWKREVGAERSDRECAGGDAAADLCIRCNSDPAPLSMPRLVRTTCDSGQGIPHAPAAVWRVLPVGCEPVSGPGQLAPGLKRMGSTHGLTAIAGGQI